MSTAVECFNVAIIGAGISGIASAILLQKHVKAANLSARVSMTVFERSDDVAGTWNFNSYPGAACDVPSHFYSFSFALNSEWTHKFSPGPEIKAYLKRVAAEFGVLAVTRFQTAVTSATWDAGACAYNLDLLNVATGAKTSEVAHFVIAGPGALCQPALPEIVGRELYTGHTWHSARWNHAVNLSGRNVGVIGTGCSAAQIVPAIAPIVSSLTVYQRTPSWVMPREDYAYPTWVKVLFKLPLVLRMYRWFLALQLESRYWLVIKPLAWLKALPLLVARMHRRKQISDASESARPGLRDALTPKYPLACKRIVISDEFLSTFTRPNVHLVTSPFKMVADGIQSVAPPVGEPEAGLHHPHDVIVYATGFDITASIGNVEVIGVDGQSLRARWEGPRGPEAYLGITVPGMPNLFFCMGPNTGLGHSSMIALIECQANYAAAAIVRVISSGKRSLAVRESVCSAYNQRIQARLTHSVWSGCSSWYNLAGKKNVVLWPGTVTEYFLQTRRVQECDYEFA